MPTTCGCGNARRRSERRLTRTISQETLKAVMNQTVLTIPEINSLYHRYRQLAPSGEMSFTKFRGTMGMLGMLDDLFLPYRMFCAFDENEDNKLDFVEFATALGIMIKGDDDAKLELAFKIISPSRSARKLKRLEQNYETTPGEEGLITRAEIACSRIGRVVTGSGLNITSCNVTMMKRTLSDESQKDFCVDLRETSCDKEDGLSLFEFQTVVASLESTRRQLIGGVGDTVDEWYVERVFRNCSSTRPDGTPYMTLADFKKAVRTDIEFLFVLGIYPGAQDRHLNAARDSEIRKSEKNKTRNGSPTLFELLPHAPFIPSSDMYCSQVSPLELHAGCLPQSHSDGSGLFHLPARRGDKHHFTMQHQPNNYANSNTPPSLKYQASVPPNQVPNCSSNVVNLTATDPLSTTSPESVASGPPHDMRFTPPNFSPALPTLSESFCSALGNNSATSGTQLIQLKEDLLSLLDDLNLMKSSTYSRAYPAMSSPMFSDSCKSIGSQRAKSQELENSKSRLSQSTQELQRTPSSQSLPPVAANRSSGSNLVAKDFEKEYSKASSHRVHTTTKSPVVHTVMKQDQNRTCNSRKFSSSISASDSLQTSTDIAPIATINIVNDIWRKEHDDDTQSDSTTPTETPALHNGGTITSSSHGEHSHNGNDNATAHPSIEETEPHGVNSAVVDAENRVRRILDWLDKALSEANAKSKPMGSNVGYHIMGLTDNFLRDHGESLYLSNGSPVRILNRRSTVAVGGSPDVSGLFATTQAAGEAPLRMYMNKPNFEQRRAKRQGSIAQIQQRMQRRRAEYKLLGPQKGFAVHFGHPSWNMVLNMMVGIRLAAGRINNEPKRRVEAYDFIMKEKISILPRSANTVETNASKQNVEAVRFIDYAPMVFRKIREFFGINAQDYLQSVGPEQLVGNMVLGNLASLSELCSEGKSGAFFYYTADGRFLIKTITRDAAKFLQHILHDYYEHILKHPDTLLTRFYGYHAIRLKKESGNVGAKLYFVIMGNFFHTPVEIHRRYDLKGSWVGRSSGTAAHSDPTIALKDVDLVELQDTVSVGPERRELLLTVIEQDAAFFEKHLILDYSLLVGTHFSQNESGDVVGPQDLRSLSTLWSTSTQPNQLTREDTLFQAKRPFHQRELGGMISSNGKKLYYVGIIDILTRWTTIKRLEHDLKVMKTRDGGGISCVHPSVYAKRFVEFMRKHIE